MKETALKFLWKAPLERVFIAVLLVAVYFLSQKAERQEQVINRQTVECARREDSLKTYYNGVMMEELRAKIAKYDTLILELKLKQK